VENLAKFIFADDQYLFIFADCGEIRKNKFRKFLPQTISSLKVHL